MDTEDKLVQLNSAIDALMVRYQLSNVPSPMTWRLGNEEFNYRVMQLVLVDIVKNLMELSDEEFDLLVKTKWLAQATGLLDNTLKLREKNNTFLPPGMS